jgi:hypothetical protein
MYVKCMCYGKCANPGNVRMGLTCRALTCLKLDQLWYQKNLQKKIIKKIKLLKKILIHTYAFACISMYGIYDIHNTYYI